MSFYYEKIEESYSLYSKFNNISRQDSDFVRVNDLSQNIRLYSYVSLTLFILLITISNIKGCREAKTLRPLYLNVLHFNILHIFFYFLLPCLILPILVFVTVIVMILRLIAYTVLKLKHRSNFGGILTSADSVWAVEDTSKTVINVLLILTFQPDKTENVSDYIKDLIFQKIFKKIDDFPKLTSTRHRFMGFNYLLNNQLTVDDCVSSLEIKTDELTRSSLQQIISERCNHTLPKMHTALWEILISPKSIQWNMENASRSFPVLLRFSHIAGDGLSFTNLMLKTFANHSTQEKYKDLLFKKMHINHSTEEFMFDPNFILLNNVISTIRTIMNFLYIIMVAPSVIIYQHCLKKSDVNTLHGPDLSGEKILMFVVENKRNLIAQVKNIKKAASNCKFSDILFAAISASLSEHFTKNSQTIPNNVSAVVPALLSPPNMNKIPVLQNQFSVGILDLPVWINSNSMLKRLKKVMKSTNCLRHSLQFQVNYWFVKYLCGLIPHPILQQSLNTDPITMTISNVPGVPKVTMVDDCDIEDIIFFTHHRGKIGLGITILTYDNRFQLGLAIDKSILESRDEAYNIINNIFKHIKLLHAEVYEHNSSSNI